MLPASARMSSIEPGRRSAVCLLEVLMAVREATSMPASLTRAFSMITGSCQG